MEEETSVERAYLTYAEAEAYTGVHRVTIWRAVKAGTLKAYGPGRAVRFRRDALDAWMESCGETLGIATG